ncbi:Glycosyl transferase, group 2 family protein [Pseudomonas syringae pv. broussonetiae]|uniref:Group 2 family glycosyl transferase n=2 Tax=Pseudomonas savastanoi TaxID=29438 RepID=A0A3M5JWP6_PSESS|nr:Glycosyl transferase, group 2 family protein [Pseudomonas syringae pv. broussonetiae]RMT27564.1 Group 2 family glycosyl transferase [Pseudomonas savastanoi]
MPLWKLNRYVLMFELDRYGYLRDTDTSVWVRTDYQGIAYSDGDSSENELAKIVRDASDVSVLSSELPHYCTDWPKLYHLSSTRGNIFRPFEHLLKGKSVLEIGAGCGAISRYLGEAGADVLALEGSPRRAAIAASRTRGLDNVTVLAERFDDLKIDQQFDVVTLIGVLEYASMFSNDEDPALGMLKRVKKLLKPDGHLFIAIENQLGLKYFAGAPEDHVGVAMYGIEGRYVGRQPKTFGRKGLDELIALAGFASSSFLSPYPDYKIPNSLITENGFKANNFDAAALACQNTRKDPQLPSNTTFNLEKAWPVVIENHLGMDLANSFMVVASCQPYDAVPSNVLAYHYSTGRNAEYCKAAVFVDTPAGIEVQYQRLSTIEAADGLDDPFRFILPAAHGYAKGNLLSLQFLEASTTEDWTVETFTPFLKTYLNCLSQLLATEGGTTELDSVNVRLPGHYIDAVAQNIIIDSEGNPHLIDIEWEMKEGVELGHLLMRGLLLLIANKVPFHPSTTMINRRDFIVELIGSAGLEITEQELNRYALLEAMFQEKVTGREAASFLNWSPEATIQKMGSLGDKTPRVATLYIGDAAGGFREERTISQFVHDGRQTLVFTVPATYGCAALRFDPTNIRQSFSVDAITIYDANSEAWSWRDSANAPLDSAGTTTFVNDVNDSTMFMSLDDDPHLVLPVDLNSLLAGKSFKIQITFTLFTEGQVAERLLQQEEELKLALESISDLNLKDRPALEAAEVANLAVEENHRLALEKREAENLAIQENHRIAMENLEAANLQVQAEHRQALADIDAATREAQEKHNAKLTELEIAILAAQENHRLALVDKDTHVHNLNLHIIAMQSSYSWKATAPLRKITRSFFRAKRLAASIPLIVQRGGGLSSTAKKAYQVWRLRGIAGVIAQARWVQGEAQHAFVGSETREVPDRHDYSRWVQYYDTLGEVEINRINEHMNRWIEYPLISIIMPVYNPPLDLLREAVDSVRSQLYTNWELCLADDASTNPAVIEYLKSLKAQDKRIKVVFRGSNGHISQASNSALGVAKGLFVALMDNDDLLPAHALYWIARTIRENPDAGLIYSDEDKIDTEGNRSSPYFKSDWNEFLFRSQNMVCHLGAYRRDLVNEVGQFRVGFEGAQDYDLTLRCIEKLKRDQIIHIPRVLYHWRIHAGSTAMAGDEKPYAALAGVKALDEHLERQGRIGSTELLPTGQYRVHYNLPTALPLVTLVIPTRNAYALVKQCIDSIKSLTTYKNYEIILIDNGSDDPESLEYFAQIGQEENIRVLRDDGPFNYSALNNAAVRIAKGELIGLINNDIEVITPEWLSEMVSIALQPKVGAVGARLWYPDNRLQHGGVVVGIGGVAGHAHKYLPKGAHGYFCRAELIQEFSAVTAACLIIKKSIFDEVGGLDEQHLKIAFNDVDFCLRVQEAGYLNVWTPFSELYHHESATRGLEDTPQKQERFGLEIRYVKNRWPNILVDYTYNPNLTLDHEDFSLAWPPRVKS